MNELKVIILAAGKGTRLRPLTDHIPKVLVQIGHKTILEHQLSVLKLLGIDDIHIITGHKSHCIDSKKLTKHHNPDYDNTNMVYSLFRAHEIMDGSSDILITYGDIVYTPRVIEEVVACEGDMCLAIDQNWLEYWRMRMNNPLHDAETLKMDENNKIMEIGLKPKNYDEIQGQYMGIIKIKGSCVENFKKYFFDLRDGLQNAAYTNNLYMTEFIQLLINDKWDVRAASVNNGWLEFDRVEDLQLIEANFWAPLEK